MQVSQILTTLAVAGCLVAVGNLTRASAADMYRGGWHRSGGGWYASPWRGGRVGARLSLGLPAIGAFSSPYYGYGEPLFGVYGGYDGYAGCYIQHRYWWRGVWRWRGAYVC
jgi:hypothetical protein